MTWHPLFAASSAVPFSRWKHDCPTWHGDDDDDDDDHEKQEDDEADLDLHEGVHRDDLQNLVNERGAELEYARSELSALKQKNDGMKKQVCAML